MFSIVTYHRCKIQNGDKNLIFDNLLSKEIINYLLQTIIYNMNIDTRGGSIKIYIVSAVLFCLLRWQNSGVYNEVMIFKWEQIY